MTRIDHETIRRHVESLSVQHAALLERACEESLMGGQYGVLVDGMSARVDHRVPYGQIVYLPRGVMLGDVDSGRFEVTL